MTMSLEVYPAKDLDATKKLFTALLGTEPYADQPYYVGYRVGELELGLDPNADSAAPISYWTVADIDAGVQQLIAAGAEVSKEPHEVGGGIKVAQLTDASGNTIGLRQSP